MTDQTNNGANQIEPQAKPTNEWPGAFAAYGTAFERMQANPAPAILFVLLYGLLGIISTLTQQGTSYASTGYRSYEDIIMLVFLLALPVYGLALADNKKISISEFLKFDIRKYFLVLVTTIMYALIVVVSLLFLVFPIIWTVAWFGFFAFAIVDQGKGPTAALKESKRLAQNHKGKVWAVIGVSILLAIALAVLAFIPFLGAFGTAIVTVWSTAVYAVLFRWLQQANRV